MPPVLLQYSPWWHVIVISSASLAHLLLIKAQATVAWGDVQDESQCFWVGGDEIKLFHTFIAQQATPVSLTDALPGVAAGPVDASGVKHAFITELALPTVATPVKHRCQNMTMNHFPLPALWRMLCLSICILSDTITSLWIMFLWRTEDRNIRLYM